MSVPDLSFTPTHFHKAIQPTRGPSRWVELQNAIPANTPLATPIRFVVADFNPRGFIQDNHWYIPSENGKFSLLDHPSMWEDCIRGNHTRGHNSEEAGTRIVQSIQDIRSDRRAGSESVGNNLGLLVLAVVHAFAVPNSIFWGKVLREAENAMVAPGVGDHGILGVLRGDTESLEGEIDDLVFPNGEDLFRGGAVYFAWTKEGGFTWLCYDEGYYWYERHMSTQRLAHEGAEEEPVLSGWENAVPRPAWE